MNRSFIVTFKFTNGDVVKIQGDGIKEIMEKAQQIIEQFDLTLRDLTVNVVPSFPHVGDA